MCGIAGFVGLRPISEERIRATLDRLGRRGPDHAGFRSFRTPDGRFVYLLHTRLSIIDLDPRANQPMERSGKTIVFNGELYNYREIQGDLEREGAVFHTSSDTEVLLAALDRRGTGALDRFEGMWAFALYDSGSGDLLLCRDRFGEKPLFTMRNNEGFFFASEPPALFMLAGETPPPNETHLLRLMISGYRACMRGDDTFFEGLRRVPAGSYLRLSANEEPTPRRYYSPSFDTAEDITFEEAVKRIRERLFRTVELRLRADVPLAFALSGGIDSNTIAAVAKRIFDYDVHGFTVVDEDPRYNEWGLAAPAAKALGIRHTLVPLGKEDFLKTLEDLVAYRGAPVHTISYYAHWHLMRAVGEEGYRVVVSGTAADELFSGYYDHFHYHLIDVRDDERLLRENLESWRRWVRPIIRNPLLRDPDLFLADPSFRDHLLQDGTSFSPLLTRPFDEPFREVSYSSSVLRNRMLNELFHEVVPVILREDDANAMYFSIENRSPFLDRELFEASLRIPPRHLIRGGYAKAVLREAVKGIVPEAIRIERRKVGFNAALETLLDLDDADVRNRLSSSSPIDRLVRKDAVLDLLGRGSFSNAEKKFLFSYLGARLFLEWAEGLEAPR